MIFEEQAVLGRYVSIRRKRERWIERVPLGTIDLISLISDESVLTYLVVSSSLSCEVCTVGMYCNEQHWDDMKPSERS